MFDFVKHDRLNSNILEIVLEFFKKYDIIGVYFMEKCEDIQPGQPWETLGLFSSFREADIKRTEVLLEWSTTKTGYPQVKIKRRNEDGLFMLKARAPIIKKNKKKSKKRQNKK